MAHPYKNTGKCGTKSPVKQTDDIRPISELNLSMNNTSAGTVPGMFAIPMGIYNRYKDYKQKLENEGPKTTFDTSKVKAMKYDTPPGAPSEDPEMKI